MSEIYGMSIKPKWCSWKVNYTFRYSLALEFQMKMSRIAYIWEHIKIQNLENSWKKIVKDCESTKFYLKYTLMSYIGCYSP